MKKELQEMDDQEFEHFIADLWQEMGWDTEVEQQSWDAGVDIRATKSNPFQQKQLIQAKRYSDNNSVGGPDIQQYASLKQQENNVDSVVVVTSSDVTKPGHERAEELNVKIVDVNDLIDIVKENKAHDIVKEYGLFDKNQRISQLESENFNLKHESEIVPKLLDKDIENTETINNPDGPVAVSELPDSFFSEDGVVFILFHGMHSLTHFILWGMAFVTLDNIILSTFVGIVSSILVISGLYLVGDRN